MIIENFEQGDALEVVKVINQYKVLNAELEHLKKSADAIKEALEKNNKSMTALKEVDAKMIEGLHKKYGEFSLQDLDETLRKGYDEAKALQEQKNNGQK